MKTLVPILSLMFAQNSFAVPYGLQLVKPKTVMLDKTKMEIVATADLKCSYYQDEFVGGIDVGIDDSGDYAIGVVLLIADSNCGESKVKKEFTFRRSLKNLGFHNESDLEDVTVEAMEIKK